MYKPQWQPSIPLYSCETLLKKHKNHGIYFKDDGTIYEKKRTSTQQVTSFLPNKRFNLDMMTETATHMLEAIFGEKDKFNNAKSVEFIMLLIKLIKSKSAIILDSFAGSGTTAHAVLNLNKQDGGRRKFILVEMMDYAESITAERVKRVINGYGEGKKAVEGTGGTFSFYELGLPLFDENHNLNEDVGIEEIRKYVYYMETKEVISENKTDNEFFLGEHNETAYYFYYDRENITTLNREFLSSIKTTASNHVIYADVCVLSKEVLTQSGIVFKKIPRDITKL